MKKKLIISCLLFSCIHLFANGTLKEKVKTLEMLLSTTGESNVVAQKIEQNVIDIKELEIDIDNVNKIFKERHKESKNEKNY